MGDMREFETTSTLFGGNAPFIEEQYERYLADAASIPADWRAYFDTLRGGAADVAHAPIIESFIRLGKSRKVAGAMVDASMHKRVLVLQMIGKFRTLGMFPRLDPLKRQEKRYIADLDLATCSADADLDSEFDVVRSGRRRAVRLRDLIEALKDTWRVRRRYVHRTRR
jgi:2-oxoglutarate dehydrogenase E1 component